MAMIEAEGLHVRFGANHAVRGVSFAIEAGETYGLVGESGSGKSTVLRCLAGLIEPSAGRMAINGRELGRRRDKAFHRLVQMVFQDPYGSLHPRQTVDRQLAEPLAIHGLGEADRRIARALDRLLDDDDPVPTLVVSHGGPLRMVLSQVCGLPMSLCWALRIDHGTRLRVWVERGEAGLVGELLELQQP